MSEGPTERDQPSPRVRTRDAAATKARILKAAKAEFARHGLGGARVDTIAARAQANKRMLYHYFGSKEALFRAVLEAAYLDIRQAEQRLGLDALEPEAAMDALVTFTWNYYLRNPEFLRLVNSENLHRAKHLRQLPTVREAFPPFVAMVRSILDRGVAKGVFRPGIDAVQLNLTIAAISYYYLTNRFTGAYLYDRDMMGEAALAERLAFNLETVRRLLRAESGRASPPPPA
ncbi:MAG: TetR/AcrR family transcriptional regulator [Geminicoccaceae bacterium]|nr:MAG: TetR/AcrR family transcriptional regulator [Geminicoccaceae bacterium]